MWIYQTSAHSHARNYLAETTHASIPGNDSDDWSSESDFEVQLSHAPFPRRSKRCKQRVKYVFEDSDNDESTSDADTGTNAKAAIATDGASNTLVSSPPRGSADSSNGNKKDTDHIPERTGGADDSVRGRLAFAAMIALHTTDLKYLSFPAVMALTRATPPGIYLGSSSDSDDQVRFLPSAYPPRSKQKMSTAQQIVSICDSDGSIEAEMNDVSTTTASRVAGEIDAHAGDAAAMPATKKVSKSAGGARARRKDSGATGTKKGRKKGKPKTERADDCDATPKPELVGKRIRMSVYIAPQCLVSVFFSHPCSPFLRPFTHHHDETSRFR